jgi:hypothetical protein
MSDETLRRPLPYALNRPSISMAGTWTCRGKKRSRQEPLCRASRRRHRQQHPGSGSDPLASHTWFLRYARVRDPLARLSACLRCAETLLPERPQPAHRRGAPRHTKSHLCLPRTPSGSDIAGRSPNRGMVLSRVADGYTGIGVVGIAREVATAAPGREPGPLLATKHSSGCPFCKSDPNVMVMPSAEMRPRE